MELIAQKEDPIGLAYENPLQLQNEVHAASNIFTYVLGDQIYDLNHLSMIRWFHGSFINNSNTSTNTIQPNDSNQIVNQYWTEEYLLHQNLHISPESPAMNPYQSQLYRSDSTSSQEPQNNEAVPQYVASGSISWSDNQSEISHNTNDQPDENQGNDVRIKSGRIHDPALPISPKSPIRLAPSTINSDKTTRSRIKWTTSQKVVLEEQFKSTNYLSFEQSRALVEDLGISRKKIQVWFSNRRMIEKNKTKAL